jgi:hypothetical protein
MLTRPNWIDLEDAEKRDISYVWDDSRVMEDFTGDPAPVLRAAMKMSPRARAVLTMGLYEWIVWRFEGLHTRAEPVQIAEVGWCAAVDPRYMRFFELTRADWLGPIEGPLWCAATWLQRAMSQWHKFPKDVYETLSFLHRLGMHVLPDVARFETWLEVILTRLVEDHPLTPDDPFQDLFDRKLSQRLGPLIGRNILDPDADREAQVGVSFLAHNLRAAHDAANPFLSSPRDLVDAGFVDTPYVLPTHP